MSAWLLAGETAAASKGAYAQPSSSTALMSSGMTPSSSNAAAIVYISSYMSSYGVHADPGAWISRSSQQICMALLMIADKQVQLIMQNDPLQPLRKQGVLQACKLAA
jgi:hypothetical protein